MSNTNNTAKTLTVKADTDALDKVNDFIGAILDDNGCSVKARYQLDLCVEEIFVNIAHYAYGENEGTAEVSVLCDNDSVTITFIDSGTPYDPLAKEDPDITQSASERKIGGLGIFLVKKNTDEQSYVYEDGKNKFTIKKRLH